MTKWTNMDTHRHWLFGEAVRILDFYQLNAVNAAGGFHDLNHDGTPLPTGWPPAPAKATNLFQTTRMVHCFALAQLMGRPGAANLVDHGMRHLWEVHRDTRNGGYFWANGVNGPTNDSKQHYGHAFVLLAASSAKLAGHPHADRLLADAAEVLDTRFWETDSGAGAEEFTAEWQPIGDYRGQNSNMHLTEALMAAYEATGESGFLDKAVSIASLLIDRTARSNHWRLPEHFDSGWNIDFDYGQDVFRPYGSTIGHWLEWTRLVLQLWSLSGCRHDWMREAARNLFRNACEEGWDAERGGFYFTVDWKGEPVDRDRYWWPCTEGIGAAHFLNTLEDDPYYETWYRKIWDWCDAHLIDHQRGGWHHQLDDTLAVVEDPWFGKPDIYHAFQACIMPLLPVDSSCGMAIARDGVALTGSAGK